MGRIIALLLLPFLAYGFCQEWLILFGNFKLTEAWQYFALGAIVFSVIWFFLKERLLFFLTLEHELTHTIAGLICFKAPRHLIVARTEGEVGLTGSNWFIALAPYFSPTIAYAIMTFAYVVSASYQWLVALLIGAAMAYHIFSTFKELHWKQPDLQVPGMIFSVIMIPVANMIFTGGALAFVNGQFSQYWMRAGMTSVDAFKMAVHYATQIFQS